MKVQPKIDRKKGEIILLSKAPYGFDAEVYKFHDGANKIATHFNMIDVDSTYIRRLTDPTPFDEVSVSAAIAFYEDIIKERVEREA